MAHDVALASAPLSERVLAWMQSEGYPLEFRTARVLEDCGYAVRQGRHYRDEDGTPREIDVVASLTSRSPQGMVRMSQFIECKWSRDHPWVVFSSENAAMSGSACVAQTLGNDVGAAILWSLCGDHDLEETSIFSAPYRAGFGGRQAFTKTKDLFYAAIQGVVGATHWTLLATNESKRSLSDSLRYAEIGVPVVVIDGELFEAFWDEATAQMKVESREHLRLHWRGAASWNMGASVDIVTIDALGPLMTRRRAEGEALLTKMAGCVSEFRGCLEQRSLEGLTIRGGARGYIGAPPFLRRVRAEIKDRPAEPRPASDETVSKDQQ
jgi:hypothetical protein